MSFEGYTQKLCKIGHLICIDVYDENPDKCRCGEVYVWENLVDETNGVYEEYDVNGEPIGERIDNYVELEIDKPRETETCNCCGHTKVVKEETYKIPRKKVYK